MHEETLQTFERLLRTASPEEMRHFLITSRTTERESFREWIGNHHIPGLGTARVDFISPMLLPGEPEAEMSYHSNRMCAVLACGTFKDVKSIPWMETSWKDDWVEILREMRPPWLKEWANELAKQPMSLPLIASLVRAGLVNPSEHENYFLDVMSWWVTPDPYHQLPEIPNMLERDIWRLFEMEGDSHRSLATHEGYCVNTQRNKPETTFWWALAKLSEEGRLSRDRLLTASLEALARDFSSFRAGWFSRFHETLKPTTEERIARRHHYLRLLGSINNTTVSFALKALKTVERAGALEGVLLAAHIGPVLQAKAKSAVLGALGLIVSSLRREPSHYLIREACGALSHESPEVHEQVLKLLGSYPEAIGPAVRERIAPYLETIAPSLRKEFTKMMEIPPDDKVRAEAGGDLLVEAFLTRMQKHGSVAELRDFLLKCTSKQRVSLRPLVKKYAVPMMDDGMIGSRRDPVERRTPSENQRGVLAALACGTLDDAKHANEVAFFYGDTEELIAFLREVQPPWLQDWIEALAESRISRCHIDPLVRAGLVKAPRHPNYLMGLLGHLVIENAYETLPTIPNMLEEDIWRFFEYEGDGDHSLANREKYTENRYPEEASFKWALRKLSEEGRLSRGRLLNASLQALGRDFIQFRAGWFSRFHEYLRPTVEERCLRVEMYLTLLGSSIPPTVGFGLKALKVINQAGRLMPEALMEHIDPALQEKSKATVIAALRLLASAAKHHPGQRSPLLMHAVRALLHESPQVHEKVLALLKSYPEAVDTSVREALALYRDSAAPSIRNDLAELLGTSPSIHSKRTLQPMDNTLAKHFEVALKTAGKPKAFVKYLLKLTPEERASLAPLVKKLVVPRLFTRWTKTKNGLPVPQFSNEDNTRALLAIFACGKLAEAKQIEKANYYNFRLEDILPLLCEIRPPWLQEWAEWLTHNEWISDRVHTLAKEGLIDVPQTDGYLRGLFMSLLQDEKGAYESFSAVPNMLERDIWRYFKMDKTDQFTMSGVGQYSEYRPEKKSFEWALHRWCEEGRLSRDSVLDACLDALGRDFQKYQATGFARLFHYLKPTTEECLARTDAFLSLLACDNPATVSFAMRELKTADKHDALRPEALLVAVSPAMQAKSKGIVIGAIQLTANAAKRDVSLRPRLLAMTAAAFLHESPEIHERVVKLLTTYQADIDAEAAEALSPYLDAVAPSVRKKLVQLLPKNIADTATADGIPFVIEAPKEPPTAVGRISFLDEERRIAPIADFEELHAQVAYILETPGDVRAIERVLAGLLAWKDTPERADHPALAPLAKRARDLAVKGLERETQQSDSDVLAYAILIWSWAGGNIDVYEEYRKYAAKGLTWRAREMGKEMRRSTRGKTPRDIARLRFANLIGGPVEFPQKRCAPSYLFKGRLTEIFGLMEEAPLPLLGTPTHEGGFIAPKELVVRSLAWQEANRQPEPFDQLTALLRLAPGLREEALQAAQALEGNWGELLRYALGGPVGKKQKPLTLWRAARSQQSDALRPRLEWRYHRRESKNEWRNDEVLSYFEFRFLPHNVDEAALDVFKNRDKDEWLIWRFGISGMGEGPRGNRWLLAIWPSGFNTLAYAAAAVLGSHLSDTETSGLEMIPHVEALADPACDWDDGAYQLAAMALQCSYPDIRALAAQAVIERAETGDIRVDHLAAALRQFMKLGCFYPARLRKSFDDVVLAGPLSAGIIADLLVQLLHDAPTEPPRDFGKLLELLYEQLIDLKRPINDAKALAYLHNFPGKGRAATLAKRLVKLVT